MAKLYLTVAMDMVIMYVSMDIAMHVCCYGNM